MTTNHDLFSFGIQYNNPQNGATALFDGNISETHWKTANDNIERWYSYGYDALNRIKTAIDNSLDNRYSISNITYDKNGNLLSLSRNGHLDTNASTFGAMDVLSYSYDMGNKLLRVGDTANVTYGFKEGMNTGDDYAYDENGNMTMDLNKDIQASGVSYNHPNLPVRVTTLEGNIQYIYDASGTKLKKVITEGSSVTTTEYTGNYIYEEGVLKFFNFLEGYVEPDGNGGYRYVYQYKDHLGNVRLSYTDYDKDGKIDLFTNNVDIDGDGDNQHEIVEEHNYYPFGLEHKGYNNLINGSENKYMTFNGKELDESLDLYGLDLGARQYDPSIGRFMTIDPMVDFVNHQSPYSMADNNPVFFVDLYGLGKNRCGWLCKLVNTILFGKKNLLPDGRRENKISRATGWVKTKYKKNIKEDNPKKNDFRSRDCNCQTQKFDIPTSDLGNTQVTILPIAKLPDLQRLTTPSININGKFRPIISGDPLTVPTRVNFSGRDGTILEEDNNVNNGTLNAIVKTLQDYPQLQLFIYVNHVTDIRAKTYFDEDRHTRIVSERAKAIIRFLINQGIAPERIEWGIDPKKFESKKRTDGSIRDDQKFILINQLDE